MAGLCLLAFIAAFSGLWSTYQLNHSLPSQWGTATRVSYVGFTFLRHRVSCQHRVIAQGIGTESCLLWVIPVSACCCNREESNHLAAASSSSSSLCLEIELRQRNKATSIIKGFSWERHYIHNSVRATSSSVMLPYFTSDRHNLNLILANNCVWFLPSLFCSLFSSIKHSLSTSQTITSHLSLLHIFTPIPSLPSSFSWLPLSLHKHTFCLLITSLMEFLY